MTPKGKPMTHEDCKEKRNTTRWWIGGIGVVALFLSGLVLGPAVMAGYRAQINLDLHIAGQEKFEALMIEKVNNFDAKAETINTKVEATGSKVDGIGTRVEVIGAEVVMIGDKVNDFGDRFDKIEAKFNTSWGHDSDQSKALRAIMELLQEKKASTP